MKRAWIALGIVAGAGVASARVVMSPTIPRTCPSGKTWEQVDRCISRFGKVTIERELPAAKLVRIEGEAGYRVPGLYIYAQHGAAWRLVGMYESAGESTAIFGFEIITLAKHKGFRLDVGSAIPALSDDSESARPALVQEKRSVFCSGFNYACFAVTTSCDLLVDGRSRSSFRGTLKFDGDVVHILGDRSRTGTACATPANEPLGWSAVDEIDF